MSTRKFNPNPDFSTKNSTAGGERCVYIVKYDEDFQYTEAYLSPEFLREYSIGRGFEVEPLRSPCGTQAFLLEQWGSYYLLLAYQREAVFMMRVDDLDDIDQILSIASRSYLALRTLTEVDPVYHNNTKALLDFDNLDIWGNVTTDNWAFHVVVSPDTGNFHLVGIKNGEFVDMLHLRNWLYFLVKKYRVTI